MEDESTITYKSWIAMGADARWTYLQNHSEADISKTLIDVHPELRIANVESKEWRDLQQRSYKLGRSTTDVEKDRLEHLRAEVSSHTSSRVVGSISLNSQNPTQRFLRDVDQTVMFEARYGDYQNTPNPTQRILRDVGQDRTFETIIVHEAYTANPGYNIYRIIRDFEGSFMRLIIQPDDDTNPNAYQQSITHFLSDKNSFLFEKYPTSYISVSYHFEVEGDTREFTFKQPPSEKTFEELLTSFYSHTENSDIYWKVAYNVFAIYVNIVTPYGGGGTASNKSLGKYYLEYKLPTTYPNSCFYQCVRKIRTALGKEYLNKKQKYEKMRVMLTGTKKDAPVNISLMARAEDVFDIQFIVMGSNPPTVSFYGYDTDGTFENTKITYSIQYDDVYSSDVGEMVEYSENPAHFETVNHCSFINIDDCRYGIIVLEDTHYRLVKSLKNHMFCKRCGSYQHTIEMSDKNEHARFECIQNISDVLNKDELVKWTPENHLIFYDFETISHNRIIPYSVSWAIDKNEIQHQLEMHAENHFIDTIRCVNGENILIAYFGSAFDTYFLLDAVAMRGVKIDSHNTIVHNNKILKMQIGSMRTWDLAQFTKCSLNDACKSFGVPMSKHEYDFKKIQLLYDEYGQIFLEHLDIERTMLYNNRDVEMTRLLFEKVQTVLVELTGIDPLSCLTLNELVYKFAKKDWSKRGIVVNKMPLEYDDIFSLIPGGRCEAIEKGIFHGDYVLVDKNSLYPHVCLTYDYPNGEYEDILWNNDIKGIYLSECIVDQFKLIRKYAGVKTKNGVDWEQGNVKVWLWKEEIEYLLQRDDVSVIRGRTIVWNNVVRPFEALRVFLDKRLEEESKPVKNVAMIAMCKLCFNGFTGKMIQKNINDIWAYVNSASDVHRFVEKYGCTGVMQTAVNGKYVFTGTKDEGKYIKKPRHWGCRIYGLSHLEMFRDLEDIQSVKYTDTDSALIDYNELSKISLGKEIGGYKIEHRASSIAIIGKKSYCMVGKDTRYRLKGYRPGDKWEITDIESGEKISEGSKIHTDMFEALLYDNMVVHTYQSNLIKKSIRKTVGGQYEMFTIKQQDVKKKLS